MNKVDREAKEKAANYENQKRQAEQNKAEQNAAEGKIEGKAVENPEETPAEQTANSPLPRTEAAWNDLISHRIDEAMRNGAFDNLRNKGKPLTIDQNPFVPVAQQMANDLLKNNDLVPYWISERTAMLDSIACFRQRFQELAVHFHQAWLAADDAKRTVIQASWQRQIEQWTQEIKELNRKITVVNLQQPIARLEIFKVLLDEELTRVGLQRTL